MSSTVQKIRANRRVLEQNCQICGRGFVLAEEVYQCNTCGGFHHVACFDGIGACPYAPAASSESPATQPIYSEPTAPIAADPLPPPLSPPLSPPPPPVTEVATPSQSTDPREAELRLFYSGWSTEQLETALSVDRHSYKASSIPIMEAEWASRGQPPFKECPSCHAFNKSTMAFCVRCGASISSVTGAQPAASPVAAATPPAAPNSAAYVTAHTPTASPLSPDEKRCPACAETIKKEAVKCRYCGYVFDSRYAQPQTGGGIFEDTGRRLAEDEIKADAKNALIMSIIGIFCFGFILEPIALFKAFKALKRIGEAEREYVNLDIGGARGMAIAAIVIGIICVLLILLYIIGMIAAAGSGPPRRY